MIKHDQWFTSIAALLLLGGCATFSEDGGTRNVSDALAARGVTQQAPWLKNDADAARAANQVRALLAQPLTADAVVQIALLNNRGLQATYAELGIAEAGVVQAGRLRNPGFSFSRLTRADEVEIERTFLFDILGLITMPIRTDLEKRRFALTQGRVAMETLQVATDTRQAYFSAVASQEAVKYMAQVKVSAETSAELARLMAAAGNFSKLDRAREQLFYAETTAQFARVQQRALTERERLTRLMGLWGQDTGFKLPERLPDLPKTPREITDLESTALKQRFDVQGAMQEAENIAASLGLTKATGFVNVIEVGYQRNSETGRPRQTGYEIELRLPLFDFGTARVARAEHTYMQAVNRAADLAVRARSEVREAYGAWRTAYDLAQHYRDEVVPLRARIGEETLLRYNGMLMSVFELLAESRQQVNAVINSIEAQRDFWIADAMLQLAITGKSPGAIATLGGSAQAAPTAEAGH